MKACPLRHAHVLRVSVVENMFHLWVCTKRILQNVWSGWNCRFGSLMLLSPWRRRWRKGLAFPLRSRRVGWGSSVLTSAKLSLAIFSPPPPVCALCAGHGSMPVNVHGGFLHCCCGLWWALWSVLKGPEYLSGSVLLGVVFCPPQGEPGIGWPLAMSQAVP